MDLNKLDEQVQEIIWAVREDTLNVMAQPLTVDEKHGRKDLVTSVDKANEQQLIQSLAGLVPESRILGEEGFGDEVADMAGWVWIVDPIDGTMNFVMQKNHFAIMIALYHDGVGQLGFIMDVMNGALYHGGPDIGVQVNDQQVAPPANAALRDVLVGISGPLLIENQFNMQAVAKASRGPRMYGSAGIEYIATMTGELGAYISYLRPWDFAAGKVLAETLGLVVKSIDGTPLDMLSSCVVLVSTERASQEILKLAN